MPKVIHLDMFHDMEITYVIRVVVNSDLMIIQFNLESYQQGELTGTQEYIYSEFGKDFGVVVPM